MPTGQVNLCRASSARLRRAGEVPSGGKSLIRMPHYRWHKFLPANQIGGASRRGTVLTAPKKLFTHAPSLSVNAAQTARSTVDVLMREFYFLNDKATVDRFQIRRCRRSISDGKTDRANRETYGILLASTQSAFWRVDASLVPAVIRLIHQPVKILTASTSRNDRECCDPFVMTRRKPDGQIDSWEKGIARQRWNAAVNMRQPEGRLDGALSPNARDPFRCIRISANAKRPCPQKQNLVAGRREQTQSFRNRAYLERYRGVREVETVRELPGASTRQRTGLSFVRSCVQMSCDVANGGLLGRQRLFHQKSREHCGGGFIEPLFEESIDFFFQIGRVIQSGKFKGLKGRDCGLLKILHGGRILREFIWGLLR